MRIALSVLLLVPALRDDAEAEKLLSSFRQKLIDAKTVRCEFGATFSSRGRNEGSLTGSMRLKGADRWAVDLQFKSERIQARNQAVRSLSDGRRVVLQGLPGRVAPDPASTGRQLRRSLGQWCMSNPFQPTPLPEGDLLPAESQKEEVKDLGLEGSLRLIQHSFLFREMKLTAVLALDPKTLVPSRREIQGDGFTIVETYPVFTFDEELPDELFVYASKPRLARARAVQLARSAELFGLYSGRAIQALDELRRRPASLPADLFWPEGGYLPGDVLLKDPWGRSHELRAEKGKLSIRSLGSDGAPGGAGEAEDVVVPLPASPRRGVGAPTERLRNHFETRVRIHLLAAAVRAYRDTTGELPTRRAALWERPEGAGVWPEGGWWPAGRLPLDAWGEELRLITGRGSARILVRDPKARPLNMKGLTPEERAALDAAALPRLDAREREEIAKLLGALGDDDLDTRDRAQEELQPWNAVLAGPIEERLKAEKDPEARGRLEEVRRGLPKRLPSWVSELGPLMTVVSAEDSASGTLESNERSASASLKTLASAQADFRANDRDGNRVNDFWTGDVAGLYTLQTENGDSIRLIELSVAAADAAPLEEGAAGGRIPPLSKVAEPSPKAGYQFRVMLKDLTMGKDHTYQQTSAGKHAMGKVHNPSQFGFCAYPVDYAVTGTRTFILNENNTIFWKDTQGEPVLEWPTDEELRAEWRKLD